MAKERNYMYDSVRGLCMFCIVLQHLLFKGGFHFTDMTGNLIYVTIDIFVMQAFFFLSGMFSKNPDKNRDHMFQALLWPVVLIGIVFWMAYVWRNGYEEAIMFFQAGKLPYALWFLVVLFVYKYFHKFYADNKHLVIIAFVIYLVSGIFEPLSMHGFAIAEMCTYFLSFVLGYKLSMEQIEKVRHFRWWQTTVLGAALLAIAYFTVAYLPKSYRIAIRLSRSYADTDMGICEGIIFRTCLLIVSAAWIIFLMNIFTNKKGFWAHIGMNTMPIYIFHLFFAGVVKIKGLTLGLYDFGDNKILYLVVLFIISMCITLILSTKPANKLYNWVMVSTYNVAAFAMNKTIVPLITKLEGKFENSDK